VLDTLTVDRPEQLKALGHPLRLRVLEELGAVGAPLTNRELAQRLGVDPGHLHFHVRMLERAGLIELAKVDRGREKPYQSVARAIRVAPELTSAGLSGDLHAAMLDEVQRACTKFGNQGRFRAGQATVKMSLETARELVREFHARLDELEDESQETTFVFTTFFHPPTSEN
jgi:DNA-binding transcriptional ArsR family regulator